MEAGAIAKCDRNTGLIEGSDLQVRNSGFGCDDRPAVVDVGQANDGQPMM